MYYFTRAVATEMYLNGRNTNIRFVVELDIRSYSLALRYETKRSPLILLTVLGF